MAKPLKIALAVIGALVLLIVVAAVALPLLFDPNDFRAQIADAVRKETGRELEIGNIELRVFPWLRVAVSEAKLGNAEGFGAEPFAAVRELGVGVRLMPLLLDRQVQVSSVMLDGLRLSLAVNEQGVSNWQDLIEHQEQQEEAPAQAEAEGRSSFKLEDVDIGGIEITDAIVRYRDAQAGKAYRIEPFRLETGNVRIGEPFDVETELIAFSEQPEAQVALKLSTHVVSDLEDPVMRLEDIEAEIAASGKKIAGGKDASADTTLKGEVSYNRDTRRLETGALEIVFKGAGMDMTAEGRMGLKLIADLAAQVFTVENLDAALDAGGPALPGDKPLSAKLSGQLRYDQGKGMLAYDNGRIEAAGMTITTQIRGEGLDGAQPRLSGPITVAPFSPRELLQRLAIPLDTADPQALSTASLKAQYSGSFSAAALRDLTLKVDDTTVQGDFAVTDFGSQAMEFALRADTLDADRYLPPPSEKENKQGPDDQPGDINSIELPTEALEKLNANGTLDIASLKINDVKLSDVRLKLSGKGQTAKTQDLSAKLYGGTVALNNRYSGAGTPSYALKTELNALQAAPFLQDLLGKEYVSGLATLNLDLTSSGTTVGDLRKALDGTISATVQNGAVQGFNLGQILRQAQLLLNPQSASAGAAATQAQQTDFATLKLSATITDGVLRTDDLYGASPAFRLAGSGRIDLVNETIQFLAKPTVVETTKGQGGKGLEELKGLTIPIEISGNLFAPKYKLDLESVAKEKAKDELREKLAEELNLPKDQATEEQLEQQLKEKAAEKLGDLLFGRQKKQDAAQPTPAPTAQSQ